MRYTVGTQSQMVDIGSREIDLRGECDIGRLLISFRHPDEVFILLRRGKKLPKEYTIRMPVKQLIGSLAKIVGEERRKRNKKQAEIHLKAKAKAAFRARGG